MALDDQFEHALADFLADDSTVQAMVCASESGRPAVEAIGTDLVRHFGDRVRPNPAKQRIGRLVRPLLEAQGFVPDKRRATARSILFARGTVYRCDPDPIAAVLDRHGIDMPRTCSVARCAKRSPPSWAGRRSRRCPRTSTGPRSPPMSPRPISVRHYASSRPRSTTNCPNRNGNASPSKRPAS